MHHEYVSSINIYMFNIQHSITEKKYFHHMKAMAMNRSLRKIVRPIDYLHLLRLRPYPTGVWNPLLRCQTLLLCRRFPRQPCGRRRRKPPIGSCGRYACLRKQTV